MPLKITQVDAFTNAPFAGNPAAVCILPEARDSLWIMNQSFERSISA